MSNLMNLMKPDAMTTLSSCFALIQAIEAWTVRGHVAISTEGMCQEIQR